MALFDVAMPHDHCHSHFRFGCVHGGGFSFAFNATAKRALIAEHLLHCCHLTTLLKQTCAQVMQHVQRSTPLFQPICRVVSQYCVLDAAALLRLTQKREIGGERNPPKGGKPA